MSMPNIPDISPNVQVSRDDAINIILSSIGMEELSLAHLVNAEAEKIQFALGTLETSNGPATMEQILETNKSTNKMLRDVIKNQMLLAMKMEDTVELALSFTTVTHSTTTTHSTSTTTPYSPRSVRLI